MSGSRSGTTDITCVRPLRVNDSVVCELGRTWQHQSDYSPRITLTEHNAAVKALAWAPHQRSLLVRALSVPNPP